MLLLTSTSMSLQVVVTTTNEFDNHVSYVDKDNSGTSTGITPGTTNLPTLTSSQTTAACSAPGSSSQRNIQTIIGRNRGVASQTVTYKHTDGTNNVEIFKAVLSAGESVSYLDGVGFRVIDALGAEKVTTPGAGRWVGNTVLQSSASATFTAGSQTNTIFIRGSGGGGGSAGATTGVAASGSMTPGGGGGSYTEKTFTVSPSVGYTYATGVGGTAGSSLGTAGGAGGNSTFVVGGVTVTAFGGAGGTSMDTTLSTTAKIGGAGGVVPTNGDVNIIGTAGGVGWRSTGTFGWSGSGGDAKLGSGGPQRITSGNGSSGVGYGGGAGGCSIINGGAAGVTGGQGAAGVWIVSQYT